MREMDLERDVLGGCDDDAPAVSTRDVWAWMIEYLALNLGVRIFRLLCVLQNSDVYECRGFVWL